MRVDDTPYITVYSFVLHIYLLKIWCNVGQQLMALHDIVAIGLVACGLVGR